MKNTWFIADTHFSHANIIRYAKRPFADVETHDQMLIDNLNRHVKQEDDVCFLGDFAFKFRERAKGIRRQLNGAQIFFIEGNHDSAARQIRTSFAWYHSVKMVEVNGQPIWLSHYAHRVWMRSHYGAWHLYGHIRVYCESILDLKKALGSTMKPGGRFANLELLETREASVYFDARSFEFTPFASPMQTYLELVTGDKREQDAAKQVLQSDPERSG